MRFKGKYMVLILAKTPGESARVGYTTSRKVGNAVVRNKVRRRMREINRLHQDSLISARDHVWILFSTAATAPYTALRDEALGLLRRAQKRCKA